MSDGSTALRAWADRLETIAGDPGTPWTRAVVFESVDSTQDAALGAGAAAGLVVVAGRQTKGRGQGGRAWADTLDAGLAVTVVLEAARPAEILLRVSVAVARAVQRFASSPVGIKWPNDIVVSDRKLAGILIEQDGRLARVGIGVNVAARTWPDDLADRAVALAEIAGVQLDRLLVLEAVLEELAVACTEPLEDLQSAFAERDILRGRMLDLQTPAGTVRGRIMEVAPLTGVTIQDASGATRVLPAATTRIARH